MKKQEWERKTRWIVSKGYITLDCMEEGDDPSDFAIADYKNWVDSKGWNPDGELEEFDTKEEAEALYNDVKKSLDYDPEGTGIELAILTECTYEYDAEYEGERNHTYKDLAIATAEKEERE